MSEAPSPMYPSPREHWDQQGQHVGRKVLIYSQVSSTNDLAAQLTDEEAGTAILAEEQTAGRGQQGRTWLASPGASVLLSIRLCPPTHLRRPVLLTAWAAVSVCDLLSRLKGSDSVVDTQGSQGYGYQHRIKWPNDVLLRAPGLALGVEERKLCGILLEGTSSGTNQTVVAGIGLNVRQSHAELLAAGLPQATSLAALGFPGFVGPLDVQATYEVARELLACLDANYSLLQTRPEEIERKWRHGLDLVGRWVRLERAYRSNRMNLPTLSRFCRGRLRELTFDRVVLDMIDDSEQSLVLQPEEILHLDTE